MIKIDKNLFKNYFSRAWRELAVIFAALFFDLLTKYLVSSSMSEDGAPKVIIPKFFNIAYTKNPAAAFSFDFFGLSERIGEHGMRIFFICFVSVSILAFVVFLVGGYKNSFMFRLPLALIVGGAIGNLYDRIFHDAVRDFLQIEYFGGTFFGSRYFPTFNIADSCLVVGAGLFLVYFIFFYFKDEKKKQAQKNATLAAKNADLDPNSTKNPPQNESQKELQNVPQNLQNSQNKEDGGADD